MKSQSTVMRSAVLALGAAFLALGGSGCAMLHASDDSGNIGNSDRIRCLRWNGQERGTFLNRGAAEELHFILAKVVKPLRVAVPLTQGTPLGTLAMEGPEGTMKVRFFSHPRWVEIEDRYYQMTEDELEAVKQVVEPSGPSLHGQQGIERIP